MTSSITMKKTASVILLLCAILFVSCNTKQAPPPIGSGNGSNWDYSTDTNGDDRKPVEELSVDTFENSTETNNMSQEIYEIWSYNPMSIAVSEQNTIERAVYENYPNMRKCYNYNNIGGLKLIGEMSADRAGHNYSYYSYPLTLNILSLSQLHLCFVSSHNNIICKIVDGIVKIESAEIVSTTAGMGLNIVVKNLTQTHQDVVLEQGQMVEVNEVHVQNVVITSQVEAQLDPHGEWHLGLPVYCASHHRNSPVGYAARITPYSMNAPAATFQSQQRVWNVLESNDDPNNYVTFYVWGKGTVTASGRRSPTGHAFVRIPQVGVFGFGSLHGGLLNDDGIISDHTSSIRYATDSCRIKVSEEAKKTMIKKLRQLKNDVPKYSIGHYDCTSFVMDIADAGGIHYGARITIQTPVGFMQELKKHNYSY